MSTEESKDKDKVGPALNANGKAKDLSHVPCKFYKVGGCTAGASCPFSHTMTASTGDKDVCAWFVKGNCKFGHKCALAHVLPGQGMAMDRKNKRAAMVAAGKGGREREKKSGGGGQGGGGGGKRPPITMSLKATMSPSAPAPALKDTDFERKKSGLSRKMEEEPAPPPPPPPKPSFADAVKPKEESKEEREEKETLPVSTPRTSLSPSKPPADFGPIGSPPRGSLPHGGSLPLSHHLPGSSPFAGSWAGSRWAAPPEVEVDDGEMFLPGSLSDLLTAEELARRSGVSRSVPVSSLLSSSGSPHTWSSPPQSAYLNLAPSNASGAFLQSPSTRLNMSSYLANGPQRQQPVAAADIPPVGVSLPQGLAAGYSRIHARPAETKTQEWGASSYGTTAGSFGGSPLPSSSSFWNPHPTFAALSPPHDRASFRPAAFASDRFADRQAGIDRFADRQAGVETKGTTTTIDADDDLFVLDG